MLSIDQATALAVLRGLHLASTLSLLGVIGFIAWVLPAAGADRLAMLRPLVHLWRISGVLAVLIGAAWFVLQSAAIAEADNLADLGSALPVVAEHTRYGQVVAVRLGLLLVVTLLAGRARWRLYPALLMAAAALCLQGLIGHAGAIGGSVGDGIVASESLHLLAAGLWLGALVPLWLSVGRLPPRPAAAVCERFSPIGLGCVLVIAGTGLAQAVELIGSIPALIGTTYGRIASLKILLFLVALGLAALNRLWLTDRLSDAIPSARPRLRLSLIIETLIGLAIIIAAGFLASNVPGVHEQPVWPLPWRFSLATVTEDPEFRTEVLVSLLLIGLAVVALIGALIARRVRLLALAVLVGITVWRAPSFALLTVEAYPTSFQTSPTGFAAASIVRGQALYADDCVSCHGAEGEGNGPAAAGLRIKPADLTMPHLWEHSDGELFWWLTHGIDDPEGGMAMPGFARLPAADRWALIDYIRAHNAALAMQRDASFDVPVAAPAFPVQCAGLAAGTTADLRGHVVHVVADGPDAHEASIPPEFGITTVALTLLPPDSDPAVPPPGGCVAATPAAWQAYAILANLPPGKLAGSAFLIDTNGWLRAVDAPGSADGWHTRDDLIAAVRAICASPLHATSGGEHAHHH